MQTTDQIIDEILLNSPYGAKAYEERQKRRREKKLNVSNVDDNTGDVSSDSLGQLYFDFGDDDEK